MRYLLLALAFTFAVTAAQASDKRQAKLEHDLAACYIGEAGISIMDQTAIKPGSKPKAQAAVEKAALDKAERVCDAKIKGKGTLTEDSAARLYELVGYLIGKMAAPNTEEPVR